jgi:hypothetical protein
MIPDPRLTSLMATLRSRSSDKGRGRYGGASGQVALYARDPIYLMHNLILDAAPGPDGKSLCAAASGSENAGERATLIRTSYLFILASPSPKNSPHASNFEIVSTRS